MPCRPFVVNEGMKMSQRKEALERFVIHEKALKNEALDKFAFLFVMLYLVASPVSAFMGSRLSHHQLNLAFPP
eukprot:562266-Pelagomonas_calceolata.AAC.1